MSIEATFDFAMRQTARALGDLVVWRPDTHAEREIYAVFGRGFDRVASGDVRISSRRPEITVAVSEVGEEPQEGHTVEIRGVRFCVANPMWDVESVSMTLTLKRV